MKLNTYFFLLNTPNIHIAISKEFKKQLLDLIVEKYGSLRKFNLVKLNMKYATLRHEFKLNKFFKLSRIIRVANYVGVDNERIFEQAQGLIAHGTHSKKIVKLLREIEVTKQFAEGYALYLAEGDNGSNGKKRPRKVRLTNSELPVIKLFKEWLDLHFPHNKYYIKIHAPHLESIGKKFINDVRNSLALNSSTLIKLKKEHFKKKTQTFFRICLDSAVIIDFILEINQVIKEFVKQDKQLMCAYIRGMMIGEGTAYCKKMKYVRIEMRNEEEIKYIVQLLNNLGFNTNAKERTTRKGMWSAYIGAPQLQKFKELIGFGVLKKRQDILEKATA